MTFTLKQTLQDTLLHKTHDTFLRSHSNLNQIRLGLRRNYLYKYNTLRQNNKFSLRLSVSCIKFGMGILTSEKFSRVLLANFNSFKSVVPNETFFNIFLKNLCIFKCEYIHSNSILRHFFYNWDNICN